MTRLRPIAVWGLLMALVVGGVAGPLVHRLQHAAEQPKAGAAEACHPASVHNADAPVWNEDADRATPTCDLCATRLLVVLPDLTPIVSPRVAGTTQVVVRTHLAPVHVAPDRTIRGPPSRSEARPA